MSRVPLCLYACQTVSAETISSRRDPTRSCRVMRSLSRRLLSRIRRRSHPHPHPRPERTARSVHRQHPVLDGLPAGPLPDRRDRQRLERGRERRLPSEPCWRSRLRAVVPSPGPFNFSKICNDGAAAAGGDVLVFLNNDITVIEPDWLATLVAHASIERVRARSARSFSIPTIPFSTAGSCLASRRVGAHRLTRYPVADTTPLTQPAR